MSYSRLLIHLYHPEGRHQTWHNWLLFAQECWSPFHPCMWTPTGLVEWVWGLDCRMCWREQQKYNDVATIKTPSSSLIEKWHDHNHTEGCTGNFLPWFLGILIVSGGPCIKVSGPGLSHILASFPDNTFLSSEMLLLFYSSPLVPPQGSTKQQQILHWNRLVHYSLTQIIVAIAISEKMMGTNWDLKTGA